VAQFSESEFMTAIVDAEKCNVCGECIEACPLDAIAMGEKSAKIDPETCGDCGACVDACPSEAITCE
jgi:NAD-dependent dihydropyrimidine dehydrogenase PreA subunit